MPRGRPYSWVRDQSDGPVIIEREPHVRTTRPARQRKQPIRLTFGFKFANPFKSRKRSVRVVHQEVHRGPQRADRPEVVDVREWEREPRRSEESASMSRDPHRDEFVPLPPRIPIQHQGIQHQGPDPVIEILPPNPRRTPEVHQARRNSFDFPMNHSPVRPYEPERIIERERDRRRNADRHARHETRRRREAEEEAERVRLAAVRERERRRRFQELTQQMERMAINERESRREAQEEARRLAAEAAEAEARARQAEAGARQAEAALLLERRLAERERVFHERQRQAEIEDRVRVEADAQNHRRRSVHIQQDPTPLVDRGAEVLRQAQDAERRRRESGTLFRIDRDRYRDVPRRQRSITLFDDDDDRWRYRRV
jgi:hypothetical protein